MTSSRVTSRFMSIAIRPWVAVSLLSAARAPVFSGLAYQMRPMNSSVACCVMSHTAPRYAVHAIQPYLS